jgi:hypothetical protein
MSRGTLRRWFKWQRPRIAPHQEAAPDEDRDWRPAWPAAGGTLLRGGMPTERDLSPADWRGLLLEAYEAYCTNPLAYAVIEQGTNFVLGGGVRVIATDARVQRAIDRFWHDPENRMDLRVYAIQTELSLFGEQFIRFFVDPLTGRTVVRQLDPLYVEAIETDPNDVERPLRYLYRPPAAVASSESRVARPGGPDSPLATGYSLLDGEWIDAGEVAHFAINKVSNALRGRSDLAPLLPWLRRYRDWLTDRVRLNRYRTAFLYDVTVTGAQQADLNRLRAAWASPPEPGTVLFHNESESWKAVQPNIAADDAREDGRALRLMIAAGAGVPEHYLSEGGNANRATAAEMGLPAIKRFQRRQELLREIVRRLVDRALDEEVRVGRLGPRADRSFAVEFDELGEARAGELGPALSSFTAALATAADRGWVTPDEARRLWWRFAGDADQGAG